MVTALWLSLVPTPIGGWVGQGNMKKQRMENRSKLTSLLAKTRSATLVHCSCPDFRWKGSGNHRKESGHTSGLGSSTISGRSSWSSHSVCLALWVFERTWFTISSSVLEQPDPRKEAAPYSLCTTIFILWMQGKKNVDKFKTEERRLCKECAKSVKTVSRKQKTGSEAGRFVCVINGASDWSLSAGEEPSPIWGWGRQD